MLPITNHFVHTENFASKIQEWNYIKSNYPEPRLCFDVDKMDDLLSGVLVSGLGQRTFEVVPRVEELG